jgi:hypothetical protein
MVCVTNQCLQPFVCALDDRAFLEDASHALSQTFHREHNPSFVILRAHGFVLASAAIDGPPNDKHGTLCPSLACRLVLPVALYVILNSTVGCSQQSTLPKSSFPLHVAIGALDVQQHKQMDGFIAWVTADMMGPWLGAWTIFVDAISNIALFQAKLSAGAFEITSWQANHTIVSKL